MADEAQNTDATAQTAPPTEAPSGASSEPAQPVSGGTAQSPAPQTPPEATTAQSETSTAQTAGNEPLPQSGEPIDIPPFDNSPTPLPQSPVPTGAPAPSPASAGRSGRDLLTKARETIHNRKQKKLEKVLELFSTKPKITNDEVEKLLHVSDATATRYLSELERQGKIKQVGKTGHAVVYTRI